MPHRVLDELLDLVHPLRFQHVLFHAPDGNHQARHVLDEDVVACNEQLLTLLGSAIVGRAQSRQKPVVTRGLL